MALKIGEIPEERGTPVLRRSLNSSKSSMCAAAYSGE